MRYLFFLLAATALTALAPEAQTPLGVFAEVDRPGGLLALADGRVLVQSGADVLVFSAGGAELPPLNPAIRGRPLVQLSDGRILIARSPDIHAFQPDGSFDGVWAEGLNAPTAAVQLADGRVLVVERGTTGSGRVSAYNPNGTRLGTFARDQEHPETITQLADGRVLVAYNDGSNDLAAYAPDGARLAPFASEVFGKRVPLQLTDGRVLVGSHCTLAGCVDVAMYSSAGEYLGVFVPEGGGGGESLAELPDGRVLAGDTEDDAVYAYSVVPVASEPESPAVSDVGAVFPQPLARGAEASVEVTPEAPGVVTIRVFDALGRLVAEARPLAGAGRQRLSVPVSGLGAGVYVVRVEGAGLAASRRVVVAE